METPFLVDHQLNRQLQLDRTKTPPGLCCTDAHSTTLPGQPRVGLDDTDQLKQFLQDDLCVPELDRLTPYLWLVSTPRSTHVFPLHHQAVQGREIVPTEASKLHLVWHYGQIFIKPIPKYLLSHAFWEYLALQPACLRSAIGFMRTYSFLVRSESDFFVAQEKRLIPKDDPNAPEAQHITWETFAKFISSFDRIGDEDVSPRYSYGELRLTRLNICSRIFLGKLTYHHIHAQWGPYINGIMAPILTVFVIISVTLSAMQLELAAQRIIDTGTQCPAFAFTSRWFSVIILSLIGSVVVSIIVFMIFLCVHELVFALQFLKEKKAEPYGEAWKSWKTGVI